METNNIQKLKEFRSKVSKYNLMRNLLTIVTISLVTLGSLNAQSTLHQNSDNKYYRFGLELLDKEKYSAAREQFERYLLEGSDEIKKADAEYYVALCALNLNNADGPQLISEFVKKRPSHPKASKAYYNLGINAFKSNDFQTANKYLKLADLNALSSEERAETYFKIAYSAFSLNRKEESIKYFDLAKREAGEYQADANYYSGYLAYIDNGFDKAIVDLRKAEESEKYRYRVPIMITSSYFKQKRYGEVLAYADKFKNVDVERTRMDYLYQIYQLAGESAYAESRYENALEFYALYRQLAAQSIDNQTLYRIAYSNFAMGNSEPAIEDFKRFYRSVDALLIDDIQFFANKERSQEEFFHTFNALLEGNQQIILTSDRYPKEIDGVEDRLKSRFGWGLTIAIEPPELETRVAILMRKAAENRIHLPDEVAFFIAKRLRSNVRELEGALNRVIANANFTGRPITIDFVREALRDLLALQEKLVTVDNIQKTVADYYKIKVADILSKRRSRSVARPRQVAMALAKELTNHSLPELGNAFGGRDHTTVLHACRKIEQLREESHDIKEDYKNLIRTLSS